MANKIKKISINAFEEAVETEYEPYTTVEWRGLNIMVKRTLTLNDVLTFVDSVAKSCFKTDDGSYMPEVKDFATRSCIVEHYTNISLPSNIDKRHDLLYHSDLLEVVMPHIDQLQFNAVARAIEEKTSHLAQSRIEAVTKQINELYNTMEHTFGQLKAVFENVKGDELNKLISFIGDGDVNEEGIVKAIMDYKKKAGE